MSKNRMHIGGDTWKSKRESYITNDGGVVLKGRMFTKQQNAIVSTMVKMSMILGAFVGALITYLIMR